MINLWLMTGLFWLGCGEPSGSGKTAPAKSKEWSSQRGELLPPDQHGLRLYPKG